MKKQLIGTIVFVTLLVAFVAGGTYAFFKTAITPNNNLNFNTSVMDIAYTKGNPIDGPMSMVANRSEGYSTTINVHTTSDSVNPTIDLFINISEITENLRIEGLIWEVCAVRSGDSTVCKTGNFAGYNDTTSNQVIIYPNYQLSTTNTEFTVYIWLDGSKTDNSVEGGSFSGYIGAKSEQFTARFT